MFYLFSFFISLWLWPPLAFSEVSNSSFNENKLKTFPKPLLQVAQSRQCSLSSMPKISPLVFQSVSAPQIEPMNKQEYQRDPFHPQFSSYDLVAEKPAGVLVRLDKFFRGNERGADFKINLYVGNIKLSDCFHDPLSGEMTDGQQTACSGFRGFDFKNGKIYKFFPLPAHLDIFKYNNTIDVRVALIVRQNLNCKAEQAFQLNIFKTSPLKMGFIRIDNERGCRAYNRVGFRTVKDFAHSREVKWYIPSMFPAPDVISNVLRNDKGRSYIYGLCDNRPAAKRPSKPIGLLADIDTLERLRHSRAHHKLFAVTSFDYFRFHGKEKGVAGFMLLPKWKGEWLFGLFKHGFLGGSWNIAFIREHSIDDNKTPHDSTDDTPVNNLNRGTVAHELAHTLGQGREFYESSEQCRQFRGSPFEICQDYEIPRALDTWIDEKDRRVWKFLEGRYSIMSNEGEDIKEKWIDRETYQKAFWILSQQSPALSSAYELYGESILYFFDRKSKQSSIKAVVSGFYSEKRDSFVVPKITVNETNFNTSSFPEKIGDKKIPLVAFQLAEDGKVLQEVKRPALPMNFKTLYHNGVAQTEPFDFSHTMAVFQLPADREKRNLQVWVLGPKGNKIYSAFLPQTTTKTVDIRNFVD